MTAEARTLVIVVDTLQRGGLAKVEIELAQAFVEQGHCVGLLCLSADRDYPLPEGLAWYAAWAQGSARYRWQAVGVRRAQQQWIKERLAAFEQQFGKAELVLGAGELCLRLMPAVAHPALVLSSHSSQLQAAKAPGAVGRWRLAIKRWRRGARLRSLLNGQRVHVVSDGLAHELTDTLKVRPRELVTIYNPFDIAQLRQRSLLATPQSLHQTRPFVIGVGEFNTRKAFHRLIRALHDSGLQEDLVLVGQGPQEAALREQACAMGLAQRVHFVPFHDNHLALVRKARLLVLCSDSEGLGNVLIEALILGVPVVSTDCPHGPREIIEPLCPDALVPLDGLDRLPKVMSEVLARPYAIPESYLARYERAQVVDRYLALMPPSKVKPSGTHA